MMLSMVKVARDQTQPESLLSRSRGRRMRDPGNKGALLVHMIQCFCNLSHCNVTR